MKKYFQKLQRGELIFFIVLFVLSQLLMWKTFRLDNGELVIATKVWSDFAATFPLIRSFSFGYNFPPEYPLFAGEPIRYHFIFYLVVGSLERLGIPLDFALNVLSGFGFFLLLLAIYYLGKNIFKHSMVGTVSVLLFLFNGSLGFLEFFKKAGEGNIFRQIITNDTFSSFGPYDDKLVSAFWSLNIYTNQKHLAVAYFTLLLLIVLLYKFFRSPKKFTIEKILALAILIGLFPFVHMAVYGMMMITLVISFFIFSGIRKQIAIVGLLAFAVSFPQVIMLQGNGNNSNELIHLGYLAKKPLLANFPTYWFYNLGLTTLLAPIGLLLASKDQRKVFPIFLTFFVIGNIMRFSPEIAANHKFFNMALIGFNLYTAYFLYRITTLKHFGKILFAIFLPILTLTGIIDIFPILNDRYVRVDDWQKNQTAAFIKTETQADSVFLNTGYLYNPANIAGRKIYLGWPYFSWSAGYDTDLRFRKMKKMLESNDLNFTCESLKQENIDYIEISTPAAIEDINIDYLFFSNNFQKVYGSSDHSGIYDVNSSCKQNTSD